MDIVKRAYLNVKAYENSVGPYNDFHNQVRAEVIRLIKARAYSGRDWPREFGPIPDELRAKR